jgi:hypothetical protein
MFKVKQTKTTKMFEDVFFGKIKQKKFKQIFIRCVTLENPFESHVCTLEGSGSSGGWVRLQMNFEMNFV